MTKNFENEDQYISVHGIKNALEVAETLLKNEYEVFIERDDCDIYCVHYSIAKYKNFGNATFYRISEDDVELLEKKRMPKDYDKDDRDCKCCDEDEEED